MKINRSKFIASFKAEALENISQLNRGLVDLEHNSDNNKLLHVLNRVAHTLKGGSRLMGYLQIQDVAHKLEDIFSLLESDKLKFTPVIADTAFAALDAIAHAVENISHGLDENIDVAATCQAIDSAIQGENAKLEPSRGVKTKKKKAKTGDIELTDEIKKTIKIEGPMPIEFADDASIVTTGTGNDAAFSTEDAIACSHTEEREEFVRVPLSRINRLLNLIGEMVINKAKSSYKVAVLKRLTRQLKASEKRLHELESLLKENLNIADDYIPSRGSVLRASPEDEKQIELIDRFHGFVSSFSGLNEGILGYFEDVQMEIFHLNPVVEELQQKMKEIRMLPCAIIFEGFPRMIRDIARSQNKKVDFEIRGADTELDKKVLEALKPPLIHILRNAVDHAIEPNNEIPKTISLTAKQEGGKVVIEVSDDGDGIDLDKIKEKALSMGIVLESDLEEMTENEITGLIFNDGLSTASMITDVSGRGIGLDVVKTEIEKLKGAASVTSQKGKGTTIRIELPLTIAIMRALLTEVTGRLWIFPTLDIDENIKISTNAISSINNKMTIQIRDQSVPIVHIKEILGITDFQSEDADIDLSVKESKYNLVIASSFGKRIGFIVDKIVGEDEIFIKNIGAHLGKVKGVEGATILPSGEVAIILDVQDLIKEAQTVRTVAQNVRTVQNKKKKRILIVEDSLTTRELEKAILENSGYEVETAIDGLDAINKLSNSKFDAVISDIRMPRMNGFELCKSIKNDDNHRGIPVIFVTSLSSDEEKRKGIEVGAQAYIAKSEFDQGNLIDTLRRLT